MLKLHKLAILLLFAAAIGFTGCGSSKEITVSGASSLTDALTSAAREFELQHPGVKVKLNFASSGVLAAQIEQGAPVDLFASANVENVARLEKKGMVLSDSCATFAQNKLVVAVPAGSKLRISDLNDLQSPEIKRIGIGDPSHVPCGEYSRQALERVGVWKAVSHKLVMGANVKQVHAYVARGEVDAGLIFLSDAVLSEVETVYQVPERMHKPIIYQAAVVSDTAHEGEAREFLEFMLSEEGQQAVADSGLSPVAQTAQGE